MNVAIIGAGSMAKAISARMLSGGHSVTIYARDKKEALQLSDGLKSHKKPAIKSIDLVISEEIIVPAVPYDELKNVLTPRKEQFEGRIVIEISNPVNFETFELKVPSGSSAAEEVTKWMPRAKVVKAFNTTFAATLEEGKINDMPLDVFIAGDNESAKQTVVELVGDGGLRALDVGGLKKARTLEAFQLVHMLLQEKLGTSFKSAIKILS